MQTINQSFFSKFQQQYHIKREKIVRRWCRLHRTMGVREIAQREGAVEGTVRAALKKAGQYRPAKRGRKGGSAEWLRKISPVAEQRMIQQLQARKWSNMTACGRHYGISRERVRQIYRAAGLTGYERELPAEEKERRALERKQQLAGHKAARAERRNTKMLELSALWNDPRLTTLEIAQAIGKDTAHNVSMMVTKYRSVRPDLFPLRHKIAAALVAR